MQPPRQEASGKNRNHLPAGGEGRARGAMVNATDRAHSRRARSIPGETRAKRDLQGSSGRRSCCVCAQRYWRSSRFPRAFSRQVAMAAGIVFDRLEFAVLRAARNRMDRIEYDAYSDLVEHPDCGWIGEQQPGGSDPDRLQPIHCPRAERPPCPGARLGHRVEKVFQKGGCLPVGDPGLGCFGVTAEQEILRRVRGFRDILAPRGRRLERLQLGGRANAVHRP